MSAIDLTSERSGQIGLSPRDMPRRPYPTGEQVPCAPCARAGVHRLGLRRDGATSPPECLPCWRGRLDREARHQRAAYLEGVWESVGSLEAQAPCAACEAPEPVPECWLCGHSWLAAARAAYEREVTAEAAQAQARYARVQAVTDAQARVDWLTGWVDRCRTMLAAYEAGGGRGRPVELLADLLARDAAARPTRRGRPGVLGRVGAVKALDADWRSGRRARPGRRSTAELAGCSPRAVTSSWARDEALGWSLRTAQGRRLSLDERIATGRSQDRAEWNVAPLNRSTGSDRAPWIPAAVDTYVALLRRAEQLLAEAHAALDLARARAGSCPDWAELATRARMRQAVARAGVAAVELGERARASLAADPNFCTPRTASGGEHSCSCSSWGLRLSRDFVIHFPVTPDRPRSGRGESGASRSPTRGQRDLGAAGPPGAGRSTSPPFGHPRTHQAERPGPRRARSSPVWSSWAYPLARELRSRWRWLQTVPVVWVAATIGAALGPDWTVDRLVAYVRDRRGARELLDAPAAPAAYLRAVLTDVLTGPGEPPEPARRSAEARRIAVAADGEDLRARQQTARAEGRARAAAAVPPTAAYRAARAALDRACPAREPVDQVAWPDVAQPGAGLPERWPGDRA